MKNQEHLQEAEVPKMVKGKLAWSIKAPSPMWATYLFRAVFLITTAATMVIAAEPRIEADDKVIIGVYMKAFDFLIWGLGRAIGIKKEDFEQ